MQVLSIVTKLLKYTLTGKMENRKAEIYYTSLDLSPRYSDCIIDMKMKTKPKGANKR